SDQNFSDGHDGNFAKQGFGNQNFADASFPEQGFDSNNFEDAGYPSEPAFGHRQHGSDGAGYGSQASADQGFETFTEEGAQDYVMASQSGQVPPSDPRRQLQAFDALYDQPPQIALGLTEHTHRAAQDFYEGERVDADFLDEGH